jgi:hypothetical protein
VQACAGLRGMAWQSRDHAGLFRPVGDHVPVDHRLGRPVGVVWQRLCRSEGWEFGGDPVALAELKSRPENWKSHGLWNSGSVGLWGRAWCAALTVLLANHGMEMPSTSQGFRVLVLYLSQCVSIVSAKSLAHVVCGCVPVAILVLPLF